MMLLKHAKPKIEYIIRKYIIEIETKNSQEWGGGKEGRKREGNSNGVGLNRHWFKCHSFSILLLTQTEGSVEFCRHGYSNML